MKALGLAVPALALAAALLAPPSAGADPRHGDHGYRGRGRSYSHGDYYGSRGYSHGPVHRHGPSCGHYGYSYSRPAPYYYGGAYGGGYYDSGYGGYYGAPAYPPPTYGYGYGSGYGYYPPPPPPPRYRHRPRVGVGIYFGF